MIANAAVPRRHPKAEVAVVESIEALHALHLATSFRELRPDTVEVGAKWFAEARIALGPNVRSELDDMSRSKHASMAWLTVSSLGPDAPAAADLAERLEAMPAEEVWLAALNWPAFADRSEAARETLLSARPDAVDGLRRLASAEEGQWAASLAADIVTYLREPERAQDVLARLFRAWYEQAWAERWPEIEPVLRRSAGLAAELVGTVPVPELFERLTNGIQYRLEPGIDRVVFMPSFVQRPRAYWDRRDRDLMVGFPAPDEALTDDLDEGRRRRALKMTRALADDTRLRALRLLAERPYSLQELADAVGVGKSTMHHHLTALRGAGLLLMTMRDKRYQLRWAAIGEASAAVNDYLGAGAGRRRRRA